MNTETIFNSLHDLLHVHEYINFSVDGGWSSFGPYSACTTSCGDGVRTKTRTCSNPAPAFGGLDCEGDDTMSDNCPDNSPCPGKDL